MSALIHFIGLVTLVTASADGPHLIIPRFPDVVSQANNVIRIPTASIASSNWATVTGSPAGHTDFVIGEQTISISGAGSFITSQNLEMPHLTCCCPAMKEGLSPDYNDPDPARPDKKSAYVRLEHGGLSQAPNGNAVHLDLTVLPVDGQITITGVRNATTQTIVLNVPDTGPQTHIVFINQPDNAEHDDHWRSYYRMARAPNAMVQCPDTPDNDPATCGFRSSGCLTSATARKTKRPTAAEIKRVKEVHAGCKTCMVGGDINCSSSSWP